MINHQIFMVTPAANFPHLRPGCQIPPQLRSASCPQRRTSLFEVLRDGLWSSTVMINKPYTPSGDL